MAEIPPPKLHPIKLQTVVPKELSIKANVPPDVELDLEGLPISIGIGHSDYDADAKIIGVGLKLESEEEKEEGEEHPISMRIEIRGTFKVDEKKFPIEHIEDWARRNAPYILYPYLREHVYALTLRCGFKPLLLPMMEVPVFRAEKKKPKARRKAAKKKAASK